MSVIARPIPSILDEEKVQTFMKEIEVSSTFLLLYLLPSTLSTSELSFARRVSFSISVSSSNLC